ncbi:MULTISPECIES: acyl-CoA dehydrogenase family protein [unclassified Streptomyces]|uniref:acyl-CoA dehydrogenase family protein n=1 Tax=unclassified Streptomyces TaxID=2593676 RepID=UPI0022519D01|nr:acyl-CoA dehydrogenase family protein [Streptomyces sp. NBC_00047]MCX5608513.1 acyl-CoA/acyl-ACP dehydrogenase [Streptomyces sp. NBC_00047]
MRFLPTDEQSDFARTLRSLLGAADVPAVVRAWAGGEHGPGRALWSRLAGTGLFALAAAESYDGAGLLPLELSLGFVELGRAGVPGPVVETAAASVLLSELGDEGPAKRFLPGLVAGGASATLTLPGGSPYALDADAATYCFTVSAAGELRLSEGVPEGVPEGGRLASLDPARGLSVPAGGELLAAGPAVTAAAETAARWARLLTAAQCLGVGEALLARTVEYAKQRTQFGAPIGSFQAVKHRLADTLLGLEFARPLLWAAALSTAPGDVAAAKLTAGEAAYAAARTALQLHGAVGYTEELDLSLWLRKARPLRDAWGTPAACRAAVLQTPMRATRRVTT